MSALASTFDQLVAELTRDARRAQPRDALQWCSNWFQSRLEEQRTRSRDELSRGNAFRSPDLYIDTPSMMSQPLGGPQLHESVSPYSHAPPRHRQSLANIRGPSPFGTLNAPGNALLEDSMEDSYTMQPTFRIGSHSPNSSMSNLYSTYENNTGAPLFASNPGDYLHPPTATILARRTSVSAESIAVDSDNGEPLPFFPKTPEQLLRIRASTSNNFIFRDLDEEQESGVLGSMQELKVEKDEVVIRQGDVGEFFYIVESGQMNCYIRTEVPPAWLAGQPSSSVSPSDHFLQPGYHPEYGKKVAECKQGSCFGELALMYGHPRAATVIAVEKSVLWSLDRITFRTIILKAAHRRRTMYEQFLSSVSLLSSLSSEEKSKIADALESRVYLDGEAVVREGDPGDTFFFVEEGEAVVTKTKKGDDDEQREITVGHLRKGDYFGELSLLYLAPRAATVSAVVRTDPSQPKLKVAALDASAFTRLLGPLREIMERNAGEVYGPTGQKYSR